MKAILILALYGVIVLNLTLITAVVVGFLRTPPTLPRARIVKSDYRARCSRCGYTYDRDLGACPCTWVN